jgi:hypothetical protein
MTKSTTRFTVVFGGLILMIILTFAAIVGVLSSDNRTPSQPPIDATNPGK